jgi:hypothetical protein
MPEMLQDYGFLKQATKGTTVSLAIKQQNPFSKGTY